MANQVYANGQEISCKAASGKSICATPDVCLSPPTPPAGPLPIPYPNTGMASDTDGGSTTVQISGQEVMLKDSSSFKQSTGDEAATKSQGMGVVTAQIQGKCSFISWSMDVKIEDENAVRHMDQMTHNHGSGSNTAPWAYLDAPAVGAIPSCDKPRRAAKKACANSTPPDKCSKKCKKAQACILSPKKDDKKNCCAPNTTGHHLVEVHCFSYTGARGTCLPGMGNYNQNDAPTVCATQSRADGSHGVLHAVQSQLEAAYNVVIKKFRNAGKLRADGTRAPGESRWNLDDAENAGAKAHKIAYPQCSEKCVKEQLKAYHEDECGMESDTPVRTDPGAEGRSSGDLTGAQQNAVDSAVDAITGVSPGGAP